MIIRFAQLYKCPITIRCPIVNATRDTRNICYLVIQVHCSVNAVHVPAESICTEACHIFSLVIL